MEAQNAKNCCVCPRERQILRMALWQVPWWEGLGHSWRGRLRLVALGSYKRALMGTDWDSECALLTWWYVRTPNAVKELGRNLQPCGPESDSLRPGNILLSHDVQQWAESSPQRTAR